MEPTANRPYAQICMHMNALIIRAVAHLVLVRRMSLAPEAVPRVFTRERSLFFVAGVLVPWASLWIGLHWSDFYVWLFWEGFNYAWQPSWYRIVGEIIGYAPLIIAAALVALRVFYSPMVKPLSYAVGVLCFYAVFFVLVVYAFSRSPF